MICHVERRQSKGSNMQIQLIRSRPQLVWITTTVIVVFCGVAIGTFMGWNPTSFINPGNIPLAVAAINQTIKAHTTGADVMGESSNTNRAACAECGVIESIREISKDGAASGPGIVGGAVFGNEVEKKTESIKRYEITVRFDDGSGRVFSAEKPPAWRAGNRVKVVDGAIQLNPRRTREGVKHRSGKSAVAAAASVGQLFGNEGASRRQVIVALFADVESWSLPQGDTRPVNEGTRVDLDVLLRIRDSGALS